MLTTLFRRSAHTVPTVDLEQLDLDLLRINYAGNPVAQLHLDRMQTSLNASRNKAK